MLFSSKEYIIYTGKEERKMHDGFIKIALASPDIRVGDVSFNLNNILKTIDSANSSGVHLLVFPELGLTGATCKDLFLQDTLLKATEAGLLEVVRATKDKEILVVLGHPLVYKDTLYNCASLIYKSEILGISTKIEGEGNFSNGPIENTLVNIGRKDIPFGPNLLYQNKEMEDFTLALEIGNDLFSPYSKAISHCLNGATIIANPSAISELVGREEYIETLVLAQSARGACAYLHSNASSKESTTDDVYSGMKLVGQRGKLTEKSNPFESSYIEALIDLELLTKERLRRKTHKFNLEEREYRKIFFHMSKKNTNFPKKINKYPFIPKEDQLDKRAERILAIQSKGLEKRLDHTGIKKSLIGISGGLDSTLALLVTYNTYIKTGRNTKDIVCISMPCFGTTSRTRNNAKDLSLLLKTDFREIDISKAVEVHLKDIGHDGKTPDVTFENAQARERTQVLMDISNMENGLVIGTGSLSEQALGWSTFNGDHMSMYCVNTSVPKSLVRHLIAYVKKDMSLDLQKVLADIIDTPISPELLPAKDDKINQKTEDIIGPYELHDFFLYYHLGYGFRASKILRLAISAFADTYSKEEIEKWLTLFLRRFFTQQFKRNCSPDGPRVGRISLSPRASFAMASDAAFDEWIKDIK